MTEKTWVLFPETHLLGQVLDHPREEILLSLPGENSTALSTTAEEHSDIQRPKPPSPCAPHPRSWLPHGQTDRAGESSGKRSPFLRRHLGEILINMSQVGQKRR